MHVSIRNAMLFLALSSATAAWAQIKPARPARGNPPPVYPQEANDAGVVGDVVFRANVDAEGRVDSVTVMRVPREGLGFERAIEDAVRKWKFEPGEKDGEPIASVFVGKVAFTLRPDDEAALRKIVERAAEAVRRGDGGAAARLFVDDGCIATGSGDAARGRGGVEQWVRGHAGDADGATASLRAIQFYPIPGLARVDVAAQVPIPPAAASTETTAREELSLLVTKEGDEWAIAVASPRETAASWKLEPPQKRSDAKPARKGDATGRVVVEALVGRDGKVGAVRVVESASGLDKAALDAIRKWSYEPASVEGVPIPIAVTVTVSFDEQGVLVEESLPGLDF